MGCRRPVLVSLSCHSHRKFVVRRWFYLLDIAVYVTDTRVCGWKSTISYLRRMAGLTYQTTQLSFASTATPMQGTTTLASRVGRSFRLKSCGTPRKSGSVLSERAV